VNLTVFRPATQEFKEIAVQRAEIEVATVKDMEGRDLKSEEAFTLGPDEIGYVRITQFGEKTADNLDEALKRLHGQGMKALILDLRGNPGGLLDQAGRVCEMFLPRGQLIVSTEGRGGELKSESRSRGRDQYPDLKIAVLVNLGSASASEIVAGCLQDLNRAVIVGERTFGKGSVQSILGLQDGAALRLTTARYYTPSHKVIHEQGIDPDIVVPMTEAEERALYLSRLPGGLASLDEASRALVVESRDIQLDRARDMLKGVLRFSSLGKGDKEMARN
jgi:carboxyl-terminal processing protease